MKESLAVVDIEVIEEDTTVYNFEVEDDHTYFVTEAEVWVHNAPTAEYNALIKKIDQEMNTGKLIENDYKDRLERGAAIGIDFFDNFGANIGKITSKALSGFGEITGLYKDADAINSATKSSPEVELMLVESLGAEKQRAKRTFQAESAAAMRAFKDEKMKMNALMSKVNLNNLEEVKMELVKLEKLQNEFGILSNDVFLIKRINDLKAIKESQKNIVEYKDRLENATNSYVNTMSITIHNLRPGLSQQFDNEWEAIRNFGKSYNNFRMNSVDTSGIMQALNPEGMNAEANYKIYKQTLADRENQHSCSARYGIYQSCY
jgi:hypothetical protein